MRRLILAVSLRKSRSFPKAAIPRPLPCLGIGSKLVPDRFRDSLLKAKPSMPTPRSALRYSSTRRNRTLTITEANLRYGYERTSRTEWRFACALQLPTMTEWVVCFIPMAPADFAYGLPTPKESNSWETLHPGTALQWIWRLKVVPVTGLPIKSLSPQAKCTSI